MNSSSVNYRQLILIPLACLALSVLFFSPRLWLMKEYVQGSFQWDRAHTYLQQCEQPLRRDIEPAMFWRVLPPLVANALHLPGKTPLALPWLGLLAATIYVTVLLRRRLNDPWFLWGGTLLFTTTSAVLVPVGWLGMNDAWVWLGLLAVGFGRARWALPVACLLCPWIDERFIIGFPLAWLVSRLEHPRLLEFRAILQGLWLLPYAGVRLLVGWHDAATTATTETFLHLQLTQSVQLLPLLPLGWWMGLRAAWVATAYALWAFPLRRAVPTAACLLGTLGVSFLLASDLSRSVAIITPLVLAGCFKMARLHPTNAPKMMAILGIANLLIPAAHMTYVHIDPINPLPIELFRLLR